MKAVQSAFLDAHAQIKANIAQKNMTRSSLVISITGLSIDKNKEREHQTARPAGRVDHGRSGEPKIAQLWPADIPPTLCTHIIYAFADIPVGNNTIIPTEWNDISILYPAMMEVRHVFRFTIKSCSLIG